MRQLPAAALCCGARPPARRAAAEGPRRPRAARESPAARGGAAGGRLFTQRRGGRSPRSAPRSASPASAGASRVNAPGIGFCCRRGPYWMGSPRRPRTILSAQLPPAPCRPPPTGAAGRGEGVPGRKSARRSPPAPGARPVPAGVLSPLPPPALGPSPPPPPLTPLSLAPSSPPLPPPLLRRRVSARRPPRRAANQRGGEKYANAPPGPSPRLRWGRWGRGAERVKLRPRPGRPSRPRCAAPLCAAGGRRGEESRAEPVTPRRPRPLRRRPPLPACAGRPVSAALGRRESPGRWGKPPPPPPPGRPGGELSGAGHRLRLLPARVPPAGQRRRVMANPAVSTCEGPGCSPPPPSRPRSRCPNPSRPPAPRRRPPPPLLPPGRGAARPALLTAPPRPVSAPRTSAAGAAAGRGCGLRAACPAAGRGATGRHWEGGWGGEGGRVLRGGSGPGPDSGAAGCRPRAPPGGEAGGGGRLLGGPREEGAAGGGEADEDVPEAAWQEGCGSRPGGPAEGQAWPPHREVTEVGRSWNRFPRRSEAVGRRGAACGSPPAWSRDSGRCGSREGRAGAG